MALKDDWAALSRTSRRKARESPVGVTDIEEMWAELRGYGQTVFLVYHDVFGDMATSILEGKLLSRHRNHVRISIQRVAWVMPGREVRLPFAWKREVWEASGREVYPTLKGAIQVAQRYHRERQEAARQRAQAIETMIQLLQKERDEMNAKASERVAWKKGVQP